MPYIGFSYPPPYGDCGSYPEDAYEEDGNYYCFRPLTGIMVLIIPWDLSYCQGSGATVSVPLRGLWFLSKVSQRLNTMAACQGFRPLTGIMVLIDTSDEEDQGEIVLFPSPYGDYGSYQHPLQMA